MLSKDLWPSDRGTNVYIGAKKETNYAMYTPKLI